MRSERNGVICAGGMKRDEQPEYSFFWKVCNLSINSLEYCKARSNCNQVRLIKNGQKRHWVERAKLNERGVMESRSEEEIVSVDWSVSLEGACSQTHLLQGYALGEKFIPELFDIKRLHLKSRLNFLHGNKSF